MMSNKNRQVLNTCHILSRYVPVLECVDIVAYRKIDCSQCSKKFNACENL